MFVKEALEKIASYKAKGHTDSDIAEMLRAPYDLCDAMLRLYNSSYVDRVEEVYEKNKDFVEPDVSDCFVFVIEEVTETMRSAMALLLHGSNKVYTRANPQSYQEAADKLKTEYGQALFMLIEWGRLMNLDPNECLGRACNKHMRRVKNDNTNRPE